MSAIVDLLGPDAATLLSYKCETIDGAILALPGPDFVDRVMAQMDRARH